jgi:hypothetical protein
LPARNFKSLDRLRTAVTGALIWLPDRPDRRMEMVVTP